MSKRKRKRCRCYGGTDVFYGISVQQMYGSNGASAGLPVGMTTLKGSMGTLGPLGNYGSGLGPGVTGATTLPRPGNWLRPAGLRHGHSAARVRLYCQAKWGATVPIGNYLFSTISKLTFLYWSPLYWIRRGVGALPLLECQLNRIYWKTNIWLTFTSNSWIQLQVER